MAERNYGIDALRIVSMLMVVILHCLGHGGVLENAKGIDYLAGYGLEAASYCAVNCFVLITGYCSCKSKLKSKRIASLWIQAFFYSVVIAVFMALVLNKNHLSDYLPAALFPVFSNQWWFFTQYFALMFAMPILNLGMSNIQKRGALAIIIVVLFVFSVYPLISGLDLFKLSNGYSLSWFVMLYLTGGALNKLSEAGWHPRPLYSLLVYLVAVIATWLPLAGSVLHLGFLTTICSNIPSLFAYTSPTVFLSSIALFCAFKEIPMRSKATRAVIGWFAPSVFAVYLISDHKLMRATFMADAFVPTTSMNAFIMVAIVVGCAIAIFVTCVLVEKLRVWLFKVLKISDGVTFVSDRIDRRLSAMLTHISDRLK